VGTLHERRHFTSSVAKWMGDWQTVTQEWFRMRCCHTTRTSLHMYCLKGPRDVDLRFAPRFHCWSAFWFVIWLGRLEVFKWPSQNGMCWFTIQRSYFVPGECNSRTRMSPFKSAYPRKIHVDPGLAVRAWSAAFHGGGQIEAINLEIDQVILTFYRVQVLAKCHYS